ncbi:hypothetical protein GGF43_001073 [Coemansia sp. RSA 2618]|nr:hypothetical protein GGF43_001073 [Coemansia sp. RSA 2618]
MINSIADGAGTTEKQLFVVYFFVSSLREFVDDIDALLPRVAAVCHSPPPGTAWSAGTALNCMRTWWGTLLDTDVTTALVHDSKGVQFTNTCAHHTPWLAYNDVKVTLKHGYNDKHRELLNCK